MWCECVGERPSYRWGVSGLAHKLGGKQSLKVGWCAAPSGLREAFALPPLPLRPGDGERAVAAPCALGPVPTAALLLLGTAPLGHCTRYGHLRCRPKRLEGVLR